MNFFNIFLMRKIDRFDEYLKIKGLNDNKVTVLLGLSVGTLGKSRKEGRDLSASVIEQILNYFNDLDSRWLMTGEGSMLKVDATATSRDEINQTGTYNNVHGDNNVNADSTINALIERIKEKDEQISRLITIIEHKL